MLEKKDQVLIELKNRINKHTAKKRYLSNTIQNELIDIVAKKVEKELISQLTKAKYYAIKSLLHTGHFSLRTNDCYLAICSMR